MDLGATVCLARVPRCGECPLAEECPSRGRRYEPLRKQGPFEGSFRQRRSATLRLVAAAARPLAELDAEAVTSLARDGLVPGRRARPSRSPPSSVPSARMLAADFSVLLIPVWIALFLLMLVGHARAARPDQGRQVPPPALHVMAKVPILKRWLQKASTAAMERSNPELASAMRKMQRTGAIRDPQKAQAAMSQLTPQERRALLEMQEQQGLMPEATNREMRRRLERARKDGQRRSR